MIDASVPANHATTEKAKYRIYHNKRYDNVTINQAIVSGPLDDRWVRLGVFDFVEGNDHYVKLRNNTGETNKEVGFDALKLVKVSDAAVTSVSPATAKLNELTTFTVSGQSLPSNLLFWLDGCLDVERLDSTSTFMQFRCTPSSSGIKSGMIRFRPYSVVLNEFTVDVKHAPEVPEVTSVSPAAAILGDPTDFTIMGKNLPSTLSFQLEGCVDIESIGHKSSTYMQFRCTPVSTGEKDGILRDRPSGTILHSFKVTVGNAPPNEELVLKAVRVDLSEKDNSAATCSYISAEDLKTEDEERCSVASGGTIHEGERVTYKATAYFAKNVGTGDVNHVAGEYVEDCNGEDVTNECTWMATPTMYVTSYGNGEIEALPGSAGQTVKMKCLYYHSPSNIQIVGTLPITINP